MIYLIQAGPGGRVKIGTAKDPASRLRELQTGCPEKIRTLYTVDGGRELESELHREFEHHREQGEWFKPSPELFHAFMVRNPRIDAPSLVGEVAKGPDIHPIAHRAWLVRDDGSPDGFCGNEVWSGRNGLKRQMSEIVGWGAKDRAFRGSDYYTATYKWLYEFLPFCRPGPRCGCSWFR